METGKIEENILSYTGGVLYKLPDEIWLRAWNLAVKDTDKMLQKALASNAERIVGKRLYTDLGKDFLKKNMTNLLLTTSQETETGFKADPNHAADVLAEAFQI